MYVWIDLADWLGAIR